MTEKQENLERLKKEPAAGLDEWKKLYSGKKSDDEESRSNEGQE